jgi:23S rRNA G2445 N2-methylase RlmL
VSGAHRFFVTCARGTEGALRKEIAGLRIAGARGGAGGVSFEGPLAMGMAVCLESRVAVRVLLELGRFQATDADSLYAGARAVDWRAWLDARSTLAVAGDVSNAPALRHSGFAALKVKDAVVDALRDALGSRPDVNPRDPDVAIRLHLDGSDATLYLDLAGEPLHRRGYRRAMTEAPLKETLAAAMLALGRVDPALPFVDPMCGSGTLGIEHALAARRIAPGLGRGFGFQRWPMFADARGELGLTWERLREGARARVLPAAPAPIACSDFSRDTVEAARRNATAAGVAGDVSLSVADVRAAVPAPGLPPGNLVLNPPYGERLASGAVADSEATKRRKLEGLYRQLGEAFRRFGGWGLVVLSGSPLFAQAVPKKPAISHRLYNGALEVRLLRYEL